ncbi:peptidylprolyl isomerase [Tropicimonas sp. IMCC34011]|uniref:peptidylprolyl isomerase n=1 Tax=Tropicimonas sp. IMCC34011 TaxID=2248759 RepID=UPI000E2644D7|nr:peptidylprolyl isomerase [Tropicimonas sp. IMCC34011]
MGSQFIGSIGRGTRLLAVAALAGLFGLAQPAPVEAQGQFAPVVVVNDRPVTQYELQQRMRILELFSTPGDLRQVALDALINDRLQLIAAERQGIEISPDQIRAGMEEFAGRANLTADQFLQQIQAAGVAPETFRDFVAAGLAWREVVRGRFAGRVDIEDADVDQAMSMTSRTGSAEVQISEIILPARNAQEAARSQQLAAQIQNIRSEGAFAQAAREYSAAGSRANGGRIPRSVPLGELPGALRQQILSLRPGEVSTPIQIPNAIALFQLRQLTETGVPAGENVQVSYMQYLIPGGRSQTALAEAARVAQSVDTCDDLYAVNRGQPDARLAVTEAQPVAQVPQGIAVELAKLDENEYSVNLTNGQNLVFLMLCQRAEAGMADVDRSNVRAQLTDRSLGRLADNYLAELRDEAIIRYP